MSTLRWEDQDGFPEPELKERIRDLLRSHSPPPSNLSSTISVLSKELQKYDDKISQLKDELSRLESHRSALDAYHRDCRSLLAPIRRLPPEILGDIFQLCRSSEPNFSRSSNRIDCGIAHIAQESMLRVSQVCILWHTIIMGTPSLWNTISLHVSAVWGIPQRTQVTIGLIKVAFERSGTLPLDVRLDGVRHGDVLELVASQSARWESAKISCNSSELGYLTAAKGNLPLLRSLELDTRGIEAQDLDFLESVPSLRALTVYGSIQLCMSKLPLKGLVSYGCAELTPKAIRWAVASLSRLSPACDVHFRVDLVRWSHSTSLGLRIPETSSNINSLLLEVEYSFRTAHCLQAFDEIFAALTLPSLRHFSFTADEQLFTVAPSAIHRALHSLLFPHPSPFPESLARPHHGTRARRVSVHPFRPAATVSRGPIWRALAQQ
ncbi:F-box domain-containing protein [Mycena sanguinolenta]|uniref:F-box domain-containing protein n=1 Tax=Mycena sanguinolenta TaxID=230812 RepID=A0A8H7D253_9AGAR|nr:F-box domain-containing protein [Mycena sanguinolenta]